MATAELKKRETDQDEQGHTTTKVEYLVHSLTPNSSDATIFGTTGIPSVGDVLSGSGGARCVGRRCIYDADRKGGGTECTVQATFTTKPAGGSEPDNDRDPMTDPPKLYAYPQNASVTRHQDNSAPRKDYLNTAKMPLDPPVETDDPRVLVIYEKNVDVLDIDLNLNYAGTTNSSNFTLTSQDFTVTIHEKKALFLGVGYDPQFYPDDNGVMHPYWVARYEFLVKAEAWNPTVRPSMGTAELVNDPDNPGQKVWKTIEFKGVPLGSPCPLDATGAKIDPTLPNAKGHPQEFNDYPERDFAGLGVS